MADCHVAAIVVLYYLKLIHSLSAVDHSEYDEGSFEGMFRNDTINEHNMTTGVKADERGDFSEISARSLEGYDIRVTTGQTSGSGQANFVYLTAYNDSGHESNSVRSDIKVGGSTISAGTVATFILEIPEEFGAIAKVGFYFEQGANHNVTWSIESLSVLNRKSFRVDVFVLHDVITADKENIFYLDSNEDFGVVGDNYKYYCCEYILQFITGIESDSGTRSPVHLTLYNSVGLKSSTLKLLGDDERGMASGSTTSFIFTTPPEFEIIDYIKLDLDCMLHDGKTDTWKLDNIIFVNRQTSKMQMQQINALILPGGENLFRLKAEVDISSDDLDAIENAVRSTTPVIDSNFQSAQYRDEGVRQLARSKRQLEAEETLYEVSFTTAKERDAAYIGPIFLTVFDENKLRSKRERFFHQGAFSRGATSTFYFGVPVKFGRIRRFKIDLPSQKGKADLWKLNSIVFTNRNTGAQQKQEIGTYLSSAENNVFAMSALPQIQDITVGRKLNVTFVTGVEPDSGTTSPVFLTIYNKANQSHMQRFSANGGFRSGSSETFDLILPINFGRISSVRLRILRQGSGEETWNLDRVIFMDAGSGREQILVIDRYLSSKKADIFSLPDDPFNSVSLPPVGGAVTELPKGHVSEVYFTTGTAQDAGTKSPVLFTVYNENNTASKVNVFYPSAGEFRPGSVESFNFTVPENFGNIVQIKITIDRIDRKVEKWFLEQIRIVNGTSGREQLIEVGKHISSETDNLVAVDLPTTDSNMTEIGVVDGLDYNITFTTSDDVNSGTKSPIYFTAFDEFGTPSNDDIFYLGAGGFEPSSIHTFNFSVPSNFGRIDKIGINIDRIDEAVTTWKIRSIRIVNFLSGNEIYLEIGDNVSSEVDNIFKIGSASIRHHGRSRLPRNKLLDIGDNRIVKNQTNKNNGRLYTVTFETGIEYGSGLQKPIFFATYDERGIESPKMHFHKIGGFLPGSKVTFLFIVPKHFGLIKTIKLAIDSKISDGDDWFLESITIVNRKTQRKQFIGFKKFITVTGESFDIGTPIDQSLKSNSETITCNLSEGQTLNYSVSFTAGCGFNVSNNGKVTVSVFDYSDNTISFEREIPASSFLKGAKTTYYFQIPNSFKSIKNITIDISGEYNNWELDKIIVLDELTSHNLSIPIESFLATKKYNNSSKQLNLCTEDEPSPTESNTNPEYLNNVSGMDLFDAENVTAEHTELFKERAYISQNKSLGNECNQNVSLPNGNTYLVSITTGHESDAGTMNSLQLIVYNDNNLASKAQFFKHEAGLEKGSTHHFELQVPENFNSITQLGINLVGNATNDKWKLQSIRFINKKSGWEQYELVNRYLRLLPDKSYFFNIDYSNCEPKDRLEDKSTAYLKNTVALPTVQSLPVNQNAKDKNASSTSEVTTNDLLSADHNIRNAKLQTEHSISPTNKILVTNSKNYDVVEKLVVNQNLQIDEISDGLHPSTINIKTQGNDSHHRISKITKPDNFETAREQNEFDLSTSKLSFDETRAEKLALTPTHTPLHPSEPIRHTTEANRSESLPQDQHYAVTITTGKQKDETFQSSLFLTVYDTNNQSHVQQYFRQFTHYHSYTYELTVPPDFKDIIGFKIRWENPEISEWHLKSIRFVNNITNETKFAEIGRNLKSDEEFVCPLETQTNSNNMTNSLKDNNNSEFLKVIPFPSGLPPKTNTYITKPLINNNTDDIIEDRIIEPSEAMKGLSVHETDINKTPTSASTLVSQDAGTTEHNSSINNFTGTMPDKSVNQFKRLNGRQYRVTIKTGKQNNETTPTNMLLTVYDKFNQSHVQQLTRQFSQNQSYTYNLRVPSTFKDIARFKVRWDAPVESVWNLKSIKFVDIGSKQTKFKRVNRFIKSNEEFESTVEILRPKNVSTTSEIDKNVPKLHHVIKPSTTAPNQFISDTTDKLNPSGNEETILLSDSVSPSPFTSTTQNKNSIEDAIQKGLNYKVVFRTLYGDNTSTSCPIILTAFNASQVAAKPIVFYPGKSGFGSGSNRTFTFMTSPTFGIITKIDLKLECNSNKEVLWKLDNVTFFATAIKAEIKFAIDRFISSSRISSFFGLIQS